MPEDKDLIRRDAEVLPPSADADGDVDEVLVQMSELIPRVVASMQLQNVRDADLAALTAEGLYAASAKRASRHDLLVLKMLKHAVSLFATFTRAIVFQVEGNFSEALTEIRKTLATSGDAIATVDEYATLPEREDELLDVWQPIFSIFPILFRGYDAYVRADAVGYQGDIRRYTEFLREAVTEFRRVDELPPHLNPMYLQLAGFCRTHADRLETRIRVFGAQPERRYLTPTGDKVFIIHGHDEAKWRELRDVLEDKLKLKTVVLKDEPGAGKTLIRKFEESAHDCSYAFALLTPDDFVEKNGKSYFQARPNVLLELGWFYGHFGRDRVCIVKKANTEMPSDLAGILSIDFHDKVSEGFVEIQEELKRVGVIKTRVSSGKRRAKRRGAGGG